VSISAQQAEVQLTAPGLTPGGDEVGSLRGDTWRRLKKNRLAVVGIGIILLVILTAIFADVIATQDPQHISLAESKQGPSAKHWFGTDQLGQDIYSRVVHGARLSLIVGFSVTSMILVVGLTVGGIAGYFGGFVDTILSRIIDIFLAFPYLIGTIIIVVALGGGEVALVIALASLAWVGIARLFRSSVIAVRNAEYVEAARALGADDRRILLRHVFPNAVTPTLVYACALIGATIVGEAALSFLGLGPPPGTPSWGLMIADSRPFLSTQPHMILFPALALTLTVLGFILLGDGLRDSLDPRLR
jgi:ABC-type dipeptide/oligopeptide/nickel transport system permease subunit